MAFWRITQVCALPCSNSSKVGRALRSSAEWLDTAHFHSAAVAVVIGLLGGSYHERNPGKGPENENPGDHAGGGGPRRLGSCIRLDLVLGTVWAIGQYYRLSAFDVDIGFVASAGGMHDRWGCVVSSGMRLLFLWKVVCWITLCNGERDVGFILLRRRSVWLDGRH